MNFFVCYDISDDKRRGHLSKLLLREGCKRVQKSVFVAPNFERKEMLQLKTLVERLLTHQYTEGASSDDSVLYIPLDNDAVPNVVWQGKKETWINLWKKDSGKLF
jgi:CRISPR-associated protein Cas2